MQGQASVCRHPWWVLLFQHSQVLCPFRPSEADTLGVLGLDTETQHALFPNLLTADRGSRWKWSDIGATPALHHFTQHARSSAPTAAVLTPPKQQAVSEPHRAGDRDALNQEKSSAAKQRLSPVSTHPRAPSCSPEPEHYLVSLRWGAFSAPPLHPHTPTPLQSTGRVSGSRGPSPPRFSTSSSHHHASTHAAQGTPTSSRGALLESTGTNMPHVVPILRQNEGLVGEGRFRSASPTIARSCVTLPGFFLPRGVHSAERAPLQEQQIVAADSPTGKHRSTLCTRRRTSCPISCCRAVLQIFQVFAAVPMHLQPVTLWGPSPTNIPPVPVPFCPPSSYIMAPEAPQTYHQTVIVHPTVCFVTRNA